LESKKKQTNHQKTAWQFYDTQILQRKKEKTLKKFFYYDLYRKTSTWCVLLSPFLNKGVATICLVSLEKNYYIYKHLSDGCNHFHFCQQSNYYFLDILYISVAPYDKYCAFIFARTYRGCGVRAQGVRSTC